MPEHPAAEPAVGQEPLTVSVAALDEVVLQPRAAFHFEHVGVWQDAAAAAVVQSHEVLSVACDYPSSAAAEVADEVAAFDVVEHAFAADTNRIAVFDPLAFLPVATEVAVPAVAAGEVAPPWIQLD